MNIAPLPFTLNVEPLRAELAEHPRAWDQYRFRTEHPRSPHRECSDIWVRYNAIEQLGPQFNDEHESVWYPITAQIPAARALTEAVCSLVGAHRLGGVLITKIPAGKRVYPHADFGWHAEVYEKFAVLIEGDESQSFCFDDIEHRCAPGDCFTFCNQARHWVENPSARDRVTLIICARRH